MDVLHSRVFGKRLLTVCMVYKVNTTLKIVTVASAPRQTIAILDGWRKGLKNMERRVALVARGAGDAMA